MNLCCEDCVIDCVYVVLQLLDMPLELLKAVVILRKSEADEAQQRRDADIKTVMTAAVVCRSWSRIITTSSSSSRRQLKRLFHC